MRSRTPLPAAFPAATLLAAVLAVAAAPPAAAQYGDGVYRDGVYRARNAILYHYAGGPFAGPSYLERLFGTLELDFEPGDGTEWTARIVAADLKSVSLDGVGYVYVLDEAFLRSLRDDARTAGIRLQRQSGFFLLADLELQPVGASAFSLRGLYNPLPCCDTPSWYVESALLEYVGDAATDALLLQPDPAAPRTLRIEAQWTDSKDGRGRGTPSRWGPAAGSFWFFRPDNPELLVKVLDGCAVNGHFWFFVAGLTDVGVDLRLYDPESDVDTTYVNPVGRQFEPILDTTAVPCGEPAG